jgi:glycosyltransferase involved in cell wall biosynthesis
MKVSVILSTYNSPEWLAKVLWGYSQQTHKDFEIIVADDGSTAETTRTIETLREQTGLVIRHVWQEDQGFQKCRILNKAILQVRTDYVLFSDGDCIPRHDFVATHVQEAEPGKYLSGSYFKLPMHTSKAITPDNILSGRCFDKKWLYDHGLPRSGRVLKISAGPFLAPLLNRITPVKCNFKGSNASAWLKDILAVNGFDERMPWGGEDREFGVRLINSGIKPKHVRYNAIVLHLDHARGYVETDRVKANKQLRIFNEKNKITRTEFGIAQLGNLD